MNQKKLNLYFTFFLLFCFVNLFAQRKAQSQPNVIVILSDDAGYADFSFQSERLIPTPNIDRIAQEGAKFTNGYVTGAVCATSRAGILTGINQACFGMVYQFLESKKYTITEDEYGIPNSVKLVGNYMKPLGYKSGIIGKWHEGFSKPFQPNQKGFDYFWGFLSGTSNYTPGKVDKVLENGKPVPAQSIPYMTDAIANKAQEFIEANKKNPFFLYVAFNAVHTPLQAKPEHIEKFKSQFKDNSRLLDAALTYSLDENVGKILDKLEKLKLSDNTIVIFTNDNGGATGYTDNYPLRGYKGSANEGGIRVPMSIKWKGKIKPGTTCDRIVSTLDFIPTFIAAAGGKLEKHPQLQGKNLIDIINTPTTKVDDRKLYWNIGWGGAMRNGDWKLVTKTNGEPELYNLKTDISEQNNLYATQTEKANELYSDYKKWKASLPPHLFDPVK